MKIAFIYKGAENLGIEYLSSMLKSKGHETILLFDPAVFSGDVFIPINSMAKIMSVDQEIVNKIVQIKPDVVAFSAYSGIFQWELSLAQSIKQLTPDTPIIFGGVHPTAVPKRVLSNNCIDYVMIGESEYAILDLIDYIAGNISYEEWIAMPNMAGRLKDGQIFTNPPRSYLTDLNALPFPDKQLFFEKEPLFERNPYMIMTSRGCPFRCSYCWNSMYEELYSQYKSQHLRRRSPENVLQELLQGVKRWKKIKEVSFVDDVFTFSKSWLQEFIPQYKEKIGLPFTCNVHSAAMNKDIADLLKKGGCHFATIGVQSGSERIRSEIYHRKQTNEQIKTTIALLQNNGIRVQADIIFGAPTETVADLECSLKLCREATPDLLSTFFLTYYPGSKIIDFAKEKGILDKENIVRIEEGKIGMQHGTGTVDKQLVSFLTKYELACLVAALFRPPRLQDILIKISGFMPFKSLLSKVIFTINGLRFFPGWFKNKFRYVFSRHTAP